VFSVRRGRGWNGAKPHYEWCTFLADSQALALVANQPFDFAKNHGVQWHRATMGSVQSQYIQIDAHYGIPVRTKGLKDVNCALMTPVANILLTRLCGAVVLFFPASHNNRSQSLEQSVVRSNQKLSNRDVKQIRGLCLGPKSKQLNKRGSAFAASRRSFLI